MSPASNAANGSERRLMSQSQDSARSRVRVDQCICCHSGGGASIGLLTRQLQSRDSSRRPVRFVTFAKKAVT
jgi:hypothetical protein